MVIITLKLITGNKHLYDNVIVLKTLFFKAFFRIGATNQRHVTILVFKSYFLNNFKTPTPFYLIANFLN